MQHYLDMVPNMVTKEDGCVWLDTDELMSTLNEMAYAKALSLDDIHVNFIRENIIFVASHLVQQCNEEIISGA